MDKKEISWRPFEKKKETMCSQVRNQDFMWGGGEGANAAKVDETTEMYFYCLIRLFRNVAMHEKL